VTPFRCKVKHSLQGVDREDENRGGQGITLTKTPAVDELGSGLAIYQHLLASPDDGRSDAARYPHNL
jgi:hypothetical protein